MRVIRDPMAHIVAYCWRWGRQFGFPIALPALLITSLHVGMIYLFSPRGSYSQAFLGLTQWDSLWYLSIVEKGYRFQGYLAPDNNVAFFPGYPAAVGLVSRVFALDPEVSLYVTAQGFAVLFWVYWLLLLRRWRIPIFRRILASGMVAVHPMSMYLYVGYTESLFLAMLLGFFYWGSVSDRTGHLLAMAGHGFVMTATRIVGLPLAAVALLQPWWAGLGFRKVGLSRLLSVAILTATGGISFLAWCHLFMDTWRLYFILQTYFGIRPDYGSPWQLSTYHIPLSLWSHLFSWQRATQDPQWGLSFSRLFGLPTLGGLILLSGLDGLCSYRGWTRHWRIRIPFHLSAWILFYLSVSATANLELRSLNRYCLPVHIVMILIGIHGISYSRGAWLPLRWRHMAVGLGKVIWLVGMEVAFLVHLLILWRFGQKLWIA